LITTDHFFEELLACLGLVSDPERCTSPDFILLRFVCIEVRFLILDLVNEGFKSELSFLFSLLF